MTLEGIYAVTHVNLTVNKLLRVGAETNSHLIK